MKPSEEIAVMVKSAVGWDRTGLAENHHLG
jgi:hypothetical protein